MKSYTQVIHNENTVLTFGKHKGETIKSVLRNDPSYLLWLHENDVAHIPEDIIIEAEEQDEPSYNNLNHNYSCYYDDD